jgi:predicted dehydrogenase
MKDTVRIGFIGSGNNARRHWERLQLIPEARVVGVCDVSETAAAEFAAMTGAEAYTDHRRLLDRGDLDAVYISIPVFAHGQPEFDVIERGLPFLVEKPVALDMPLAREIERRVRENGLISAVGYQLRYGKTADEARRALSGKRIGLLSGRYWSPHGAGDPNNWILQMERSGGQLVEQATHTVDMMRFFGGEITEVYCASTRQVVDRIDCPDFNAVTLKFESGAVGSLTTSWSYAQGGVNTNVVDVLFEDALLNWTYNRLTVYQGGTTAEFTEPGPTVDAVFVDAVRKNDPGAIRSPFGDALVTLAVTLAMNRSAREGRAVKVAEVG